MNDVMRIIKEDSLDIISQQFDNDCSIQLSIRKTQVEQTLLKMSKLDDVTAKYNYSL